MRTTLTKPPIRFAADALLGLAVFMGLTVATLGPSAASGLLGMEANSLPLVAHSFISSPVINGPHAVFMGLAAVFSALFALNFAFIRHLRTAHTAIRRPAQATPPLQEPVPYL